MTFNIVFTSRFDKEYKKAKQRGKKIQKLDAIFMELAMHGQVPQKNRPHILSGDWAGVWECHIESDWLLIYEIRKNEIILRRTGTHSDLFKK